MQILFKNWTQRYGKRLSQFPRYRYNQYYFRCDCGACAQNWPTYQGLPNTMQICNSTRNGGDNALSAGESKAVLAEANKMSKAFKKNFEAVLQVRAIMKSLIKSGTAPRTPPPKNFRGVRYLLTWDPRNPFKHEILTDCLNFFFREISLNPSVQCWTT